MECIRCKGLMVFEEFFSGGENSLPWSYKGWRCLDCGEIIDPLILLNREKTLPEESTKEDLVLNGSNHTN